MMTGNRNGAHGAVGCIAIAAASPIVAANSSPLTKFCPGYVTGRCGTHFTSCSFPAAISEPVNVR